MSNTFIPEDLINTYPFDNQTANLTQLKDFLIHHYNNQTLRKFKSDNVLLTKEEMLMTMPNKIIEYFSGHSVGKQLMLPQLRDYI